MSIILNNSLKVRLNYGPDLLVSWTEYGKFADGSTNNRIYFPTGGYKTRDTSWGPVRANALASTSLKKRSLAMNLFVTKSIEFLTNLDEVVASYTHTLSPPNDGMLIAGNSNLNITGHALLDDNNRFEQDAEGNLIVSLIPDNSFPVIVGMDGKVITKAVITFKDNLGTVSAIFEASVSSHTGNGDIKMNTTSVRSGGYVQVAGLDSYVIKLPNAFPVTA